MDASDYIRLGSECTRHFSRCKLDPISTPFTSNCNRAEREGKKEGERVAQTEAFRFVQKDFRRFKVGREGDHAGLPCPSPRLETRGVSLSRDMLQQLASQIRRAYF